MRFGQIIEFNCYPKGMCFFFFIYLSPITLFCWMFMPVSILDGFPLLKKCTLCFDWFITKTCHCSTPSGTSSLHLHLAHSHFPLPHHSSVNVCHLSVCSPATLSIAPCHYLSLSALFFSFDLTFFLVFLSVCVCCSTCLLFLSHPADSLCFRTTEINIGLCMGGF